MWYIYTLFSDTSLGEIIENINICFVQYNVKKNMLQVVSSLS